MGSAELGSNALRVIRGDSRARLPLGGEGAAEPGAELGDWGSLLGADVDVRQRAEPSDLAFARSGEDARHAVEAARARRRRELGAEQVFADVLVEEEDVGGAALGDRLQFEVERAERDVDDSGCLQRRGT